MSYSPPVARASSWASTSSSGPEVASRIPLLFGLLACLLSLVLAIWTATTATVEPIVASFSFPLAAEATWALSVAGYILTPFGTIAALAWDQLSQRHGLRNRNFVLKPRYSTALRGIAIVGFLLGIWHILNIAHMVAGVA